MVKEGSLTQLKKALEAHGVHADRLEKIHMVKKDQLLLVQVKKYGIKTVVL